MRLNLNSIRNKCQEEKYYEAIKYMAHTLTDRDRYLFIKQVCNYNLYLGAICATTCEYERKIDAYIRNQLNDLFKEKHVRYYDKKTGQNYEYTKKVGKNDIEMFVMASYEIGNFKAVKWAIFNYEVSINTLIKIGQKVSEPEYVDLLLTISRSNNHEKMNTMCRIRSALSQKNNSSVFKLLNMFWNKNRQIFTYLANAFGWLPDLDSNDKYGEMIYAKCFEGADNSIAFNNIIINAISVNYRDGLERLFRIIDRYGTDEVKRNLYMLFYIKLQNRFPIYKSEYKALEGVRNLEKRELYLGKKTISDVLYHNASSWLNIFDLVYYFPFIKELDLKVTDIPLSRNTYPLNRYIEAYKDTPISKIIYTYFNTIYCNYIYLDDFVMLISEHYNIVVSEICSLLNEYEDEGKVIQRGKKSFFRHQWKTIKNPITTSEVKIGIKYRIQYLEYDYIGHQFYVKVETLDKSETS